MGRTTMGSMGTLLVAAGLAAATPVAAQEVDWRTSPDPERCERSGDRDRERHCEVREATLPFSGSLAVDGGANGGVQVTAWDRSEVRVVARVWANAGDEVRARALAEDVRIDAGGGSLRAQGPETGRRESWGVSWEVTVPREADLRLETHNGGIRVEGVRGTIDFDATNGGVRLVGVGGDVRGRTANGGLHVELAGDRWIGRGLDARTTNGGVRIVVPEGYSADLETGTVNGGVDIDFPVTVRGRIGRSITTTLGDGGAPIRVMTTNGGVRVQRR